MTPKEELMQAIQTSPDDVVSLLLRTLKQLQRRSQMPDDVGTSDMETERPEEISDRLREKNGFLVVETEPVESLDIVEFIKDMREERIQKFIDQCGL